MLTLAQIIGRITAGSGLGRDEVMARIRDMQEELHGFVTEEGAASVIAHGLKVSLLEEAPPAPATGMQGTRIAEAVYAALDEVQNCPEDVAPVERVRDLAERHGVLGHTFDIFIQEEIRQGRISLPTLGYIKRVSRSTPAAHSAAGKKIDGGKKLVLEFDVEVPKQLDEGKHEGVINQLELRDTKNRRGQPIKYLDVYVRPDGSDFDLKVGYSPFVSESSRLGKLLSRFGADISVGKKVRPEEILLNRRCSFVTVNEETKDGVFARIPHDSLKPAAAPEAKPQVK